MYFLNENDVCVGIYNTKEEAVKDMQERMHNILKGNACYTNHLTSFKSVELGNKVYAIMSIVSHDNWCEVEDKYDIKYKIERI